MKKYILPTVTVLFLFVGFLLGTAFNKANAQRFYIQNGQLMVQQENKISQLLYLMNQAYVDPLNVDSITDEVMQELVQKLDPHSSYIPKKDLELVNSQLANSFSGIGVQFSIQQDTIGIVAVIAGGPSESVGLLAGDKIVEVDDSVFVGKGITNEKVMHTLRGEKGTTVKLGVRRSGEDELLHFTITRGDIPVYSIDANFMITPTVGFVRVNKFGEGTYDEFLTALNKLKQQGATNYIIDLRENSGGYMDQAIRMANEFLDLGDMIVYAEGNAYPRYEAKANGLGRFKKAKIAVLIDDFSASASEIFAGAIQDNDRGTIIGRRSFGKGLVQQQMSFADSSAVRLTVARYYTPSGRCIQKPYKLGEQTDYELELLERYENGEMFSQDSIHYADSTIYRTKSGRAVLGGGGIMPDLFVGRDTTLNTPYYNKAVNKAYTYQFAYQYTNNNRNKMKQYKDWQSLEAYLLRSNWLPEFIAFCKSKGLEEDAAQIEKSKPLIIRLINAYIVRDMLGDEGFFPLYERDDEITKRALEFLQTGI